MWWERKQQKEEVLPQKRFLDYGPISMRRSYSDWLLFSLEDFKHLKEQPSFQNHSLSFWEGLLMAAALFLLCFCKNLVSFVALQDRKHRESTLIAIFFPQINLVNRLWGGHFALFDFESIKNCSNAACL